MSQNQAKLIRYQVGCSSCRKLPTYNIERSQQLVIDCDFSSVIKNEEINQVTLITRNAISYELIELDTTLEEVKKHLILSLNPSNIECEYIKITFNLILDDALKTQCSQSILIRLIF